MKRKVLAAILAGCMAVGMFAGCGSSSDGNRGSANGETAENEGEVEVSSKTVDVNEDGTVNNPEAVEVDENKLVFWSLFTGGDGKFMDRIIEDYNSKSPTKEVQSIMLVWDDYYTKLQTAVAADKGPDIGISHASKLAELVDQGVVEPIDGYLDELGIDLTAMYSQNALDSVTFDGQIYAIPLDTHAEVLWYNTDILAEAGVELNADGQLDISSIDDFTSILEKCKDVMADGESVIALTNAGDDPYRIWWATYFQMGGTPLVNDEGTEVTMDKDMAAEAADFVKSLYDNGYAAEGIEDHQQFFQSGKSAFYIGGTWACGVLESTEGLNFGVQVWPKLYDNDACWADSHTLILPVNSDRTEEESKAAVEFLVSASNEGGSIWAESGQIPSSNEVRDSQEYKDMPYRSNYQSAADNAVMPSKNAHFYAMKAGIIESLDTLWTGTADSAAAIDALIAELESNLE